jgi:putative endonuclease
MHNVQKGKTGEAVALQHLKSIGYEIAAVNYRSRNGEVDIIAKEGSTFVFVEVKARANAAYGYPSEAVGHVKQKRIRMVAQEYLGQQALNYEMRFDVIEVYLQSKKLRHIKNAF